MESMHNLLERILFWTVTLFAFLMLCSSLLWVFFDFSWWVPAKAHSFLGELREFFILLLHIVGIVWCGVVAVQD